MNNFDELLKISRPFAIFVSQTKLKIKNCNFSKIAQNPLYFQKLRFLEHQH